MPINCRKLTGMRIWFRSTIGSVGEIYLYLVWDDTCIVAFVKKPSYRFAATVAVGGGGDPLPAINRLAHLQVTVLSSLVDDEALEKMLRRREFAGASWRVPADLRERLGSVSPTYAWSKRQTDGSVGVEFALFVEDEELIAILRPVRLTPP